MAKAVMKKNWFEIIAPDVFDNETVSETPAEKDHDVLERTVKVGLKDLMPSSDKYYMDVTLQVREVDGKKAKTELVGHTTSKEFVSKMVRRRSDRIDQVSDVTTKDDRRVRVKLIASTIKNTNSAAKTSIRKKMDELVHEKAEKKDYDDFMRSIFQGEFQEEVNDACSTIYPLRSVEFRKTELLN